MTNKKTESLGRVVEAAIDAFSTCHYDDVLIAQIAAQARCSTATVYEAFGTKESLYEHVRGRLFDQRSRQGWLDRRPGPPSLEFVLDYLSELFQTLTSPQLTMLMTPADATRATGYMPMEHTGPDFDSIVREISRCMDAGLLRAGDPHAFGFLVMAGVSYEPIWYNLTCRIRTPLDLRSILLSIFSPLTTEKGAEALQAYLTRLESPIPEPSAPARLHELMHLKAQPEHRRRAVAEALAALEAWRSAQGDGNTATT